MSGRGLELDVRGEIRIDEPLSRHSSWRVGGVADRWVQPVDVDDLIGLLGQLPANEPITWIGLGSNLLIRDGGIRGTVICTARLNRIEHEGGHRWRVETGAPCARVARLTARVGSRGAEFMCGIPGTMGGALAMNAGAHGGETWPLVEHYETIDRAGGLARHPAGDMHWSYRHAEVEPGLGFTRCWLQLEAGEPAEAEARIRELIEHRNRTQPTGKASCGSVFRNPPGDYAGRLIESAGLKGFRIGGAQVSERHANFIVNEAGARASDMEQLLQAVVQRVEAVHGVRLEPEVRIIGESDHG
jgi:UDP-N-acetylmuramate dehydrogenase